MAGPHCHKSTERLDKRKYVLVPGDGGTWVLIKCPIHGQMKDYVVRRPGSFKVGKGGAKIHRTWALASGRLCLSLKGLLLSATKPDSRFSSFSMFQPLHLLLPAYQGENISPSFLSLQQIHSPFSVLRTSLLWTGETSCVCVGEVTKITTLGNPQRVKKVELQLPLAFTEVEMEQGSHPQKRFPDSFSSMGPHTLVVTPFFPSFMPELGDSYSPAKVLLHSAPIPSLLDISGPTDSKDPLEAK